MNLFFQALFLACLFSGSVILGIQPPQNCADEYAIIAPNQYHQPKKELAPAIVARARAGTFRAPSGRDFERGETVAVTWSAPTKEGATIMPIPKSGRGLLVGVGNDRKGRPVLILDCGAGTIVEIPTDRINLVESSSANITPSDGTGREKWRLAGSIAKVAGRAIWVGVGNSLLPYLGRLSAQGVFLNLSLHELLQLYHHSPAAFAGVVAAGGGMLALKSGRHAFHLLLDGVGTLGRIGGTLAGMLWNYPLEHQSAKENRANWRDVNALSAASPPGAELKGELLNTRFVDIADKVRLFVVPSQKNGDSQFIARARKAYETARAVKRYMQSLGCPDLSEEISMWFVEDGMPGIGGPETILSKHVIYMGPLTMTKDEVSAMQSKGVTMSPEQARSEGTDPMAAGHEMVHAMTQTLLDKENADYFGETIAEFLSDYFVTSATNAFPVLGPGLYSNGSMREGLTRQYPSPYPWPVNMNSIAQIDGDGHRDSQLLFRLTWRLRTLMGREALDPILLRSIVDAAKKRSDPNYSAGLASQRSRRDVYLFVGSLAHHLRVEGQANAADQLYAYAKEMGMPSEFLRSLSFDKPEPDKPSTESPRPIGLR